MVELNFQKWLMNNRPSEEMIYERARCLGNGWTVDVIAHIFTYLKELLTNG